MFNEWKYMKAITPIILIEKQRLKVDVTRTLEGQPASTSLVTYAQILPRDGRGVRRRKMTDEDRAPKGVLRPQAQTPPQCAVRQAAGSEVPEWQPEGLPQKGQAQSPSRGRHPHRLWAREKEAKKLRGRSKG